MESDKTSITIPSDFILVRFEILGDLYSMNDYFNAYLDHINRGYKDTRGFDDWISFLKKVYIQLRSSLKKETKYSDINNIMEEVLVKDRKLTDQEARKITLKINDFVYSIGLTDITQEKRDLGKIFGQL